MDKLGPYYTEWMRQLRDEVRGENAIVDRPENWGVMWRRLDHHLANVYAILNDIVRVEEGEDPAAVEGGTLDTAMVSLDCAAADLHDLARRIDRLINTTIEDYRQSAA